MSSIHITLKPEKVTEFYQTGKLPHMLDVFGRPLAKPNDYVIYVDQEGNDIAMVTNGQLIDKYDKNIRFSNVLPRNPEQACAMHLLKRASVPIKFIVGRAGSGKDYLISHYAADALRKGNFEKIIFIRNNVQLKDTHELGALPGDLNEKTDWMSAPLKQAIGEEAYQYRLSQGIIQNEFLGHIRGRSYENSIVIVTEAQNLTKYHIGLIMSRIGEGSELIINGDFIAQRDEDVFAGGLENSIDILEASDIASPYVGVVELIKCERSKVASLAEVLGV